MSPPYPQKSSTFTVMTYNIHSCVNVYGRENPAAIARIIALLDPDAVALQEVDAMGPQMNYRHQAEWIASRLDMQYHFYPLRNSRWGKFGSAVLSKHAMSVVKTGIFPGASANQIREPRGAIWVRCRSRMGHINLINTHLSLRMQDRLYQIRHLMGKDWLGGIGPDEPAILCGDFNAGARSLLYRVVTSRYTDAQLQAGHKGYPKPTFFSLYPVLRLDHIFISDRLLSERVKVPLDMDTRKASDHLPVWALLSLKTPRRDPSWDGGPLSGGPPSPV